MDIRQIKQAETSLIALKKKLEEIERRTNNNINVFDASGMGVQEIKHSAFLAWLLDPNKPHGLGNTVLKLFFEQLECYVSDNGSGDLSNREIINKTQALSRLDDLISDPDIEVVTEKVVVNKESRIDIFIASHKAQTVAVVENKTFTTMHDDQLNRYKNELKAHHEYKKYKKIYIYLTPRGDSPEDEDWCTFDYARIVAIIRSVYTRLPKSKEFLRLRILMEDYMELVETDILKSNKELRRLCKEILREHGDAIRILNEYTDNAADVIVYCRDYLSERLNCKVCRNSNLRLEIYTKRMEDFFGSNGENILYDDGQAKSYFGIAGGDGPIVAFCSITKHSDVEWSLSQKKIMQKVMPDKRAGSKYFTYYRLELLSEDDRQCPFDEVKSKLQNKLDGFIRKICGFEDMFDSNPA